MSTPNKPSKDKSKLEELQGYLARTVIYSLKHNNEVGISNPLNPTDKMSLQDIDIVLRSSSWFREAIQQAITEAERATFRAGQLDCRNNGDPRNHKHFEEVVKLNQQLEDLIRESIFSIVHDTQAKDKLVLEGYVRATVEDIKQWMTSLVPEEKPSDEDGGASFWDDGWNAHRKAMLSKLEEDK